MQAVALSLYTLPPTIAREELLSAAERAEVARLNFGQRRRNEWIRGRVAARRALLSRFGEAARPLSLLVEPDGAPRIEGASTCALSLSHDGDYFAVAIATQAQWRVGVDICLRAHETRLQRILKRLAVRCHGLDAVAQWAAIECFLKLRRQGVTAVLEMPLVLEPCAGGAEVSALGATMRVSLWRQPGFVVAWGGEFAA
jgi:phosphopantetheinyl transferase